MVNDVRHIIADGSIRRSIVHLIRTIMTLLGNKRICDVMHMSGIYILQMIVQKTKYMYVKHAY